uniref:Uncharacterized protein n=1 Tax=Anguilla anguilla TaxID=7936 RepID=A0A0E9RGK5_ANGAN
MRLASEASVRAESRFCEARWVG